MIAEDGARDAYTLHIAIPKDMTYETIKVMAQYPNICRFIHLPVQSGSNNVLKAMNRKYTREWFFLDQKPCAA